MKKTQYYILASYALMMLMASCHSQSEPLPDPRPQQAARTLLVYMVANNSLGSYDLDISDLSEMQMAAREGVLGTNRLVVYHSPYAGGAPVLKEVLKDGSIDTLKIYEAGILSVTKRQMRQVINDVQELAPAKDYGLVLWSHAMGWTQDGVLEPIEYQAHKSRSAACYSYGQDKGQKMNITSLAQALDGAGFSFVYFDCCYMGSVEVAYEMRNVTPYIVAGPTETPLQGMPYHLNLKYLLAPEPNLIAAAKSTFEYNTKSYNISDCPVSAAVYDTGKLEALADVTARVMAEAAVSYPDGYKPQKFGGANPALKYFFDLEHYVRALCEDDELFATWSAALHDVVLYSDCTPSIWGYYDVQTCCGLSTYIMQAPSDAATAGYNQLQWYTDVSSKLF